MGAFSNKSFKQSAQHSYVYSNNSYMFQSQLTISGL